MCCYEASGVPFVTELDFPVLECQLPSRAAPIEAVQVAQGDVLIMPIDSDSGAGGEVNASAVDGDAVAANATNTANAAVPTVAINSTIRGESLWLTDRAFLWLTRHTAAILSSLCSPVYELVSHVIPSRFTAWVNRIPLLSMLPSYFAQLTRGQFERDLSRVVLMTWRVHYCLVDYGMRYSFGLVLWLLYRVLSLILYHMVWMPLTFVGHYSRQIFYLLKPF